MTFAYLNGDFLSLAEAKVSVLDRGFLFGDAIYETIAVYNKRLFLIEQHLERLVNSLHAIQVSLPFTQKDLLTILEKLLTYYEEPSLALYLQITRGCDVNRNHAIPTTIKPTILAFCMPIFFPSIAQLQQGYKVVTTPDTRWQLCHIKATTLLPNVLAYHQALKIGVDDAIFIKDGHAIEGTASNLFIVKNDTLITTPQSPHILTGVTRQLVLQLAKQEQLPTMERTITMIDLLNADEVWLTSSLKDIRPIVEVDRQTIGSGKAGPTWQRLIKAYQAYRDSITSNQVECALRTV